MTLVVCVLTLLFLEVQSPLGATRYTTIESEPRCQAPLSRA